MAPIGRPLLREIKDIRDGSKSKRYRVEFYRAMGSLIQAESFDGGREYNFGLSMDDSKSIPNRV